MNDWHLDPPDEDEGIKCPACKEWGCSDFLTGNSLILMIGCDECGYRWFVPVPADPSPEDYDCAGYDCDYIYPPKCHHGNEWHECQPCLVAGDFAYDAARERQ